MPRILGRIIDFARERRLGQRAVELAVGAATRVRETARSPFALSVFRKLIASAVGGLITFCHVKFGWDLVSFFGDDFEVGLIEAITAYLVWRLPNAAPAR